VITRMEHEAFSMGKDLTGVIVEHGFDFFEEASEVVMSNGLTVYELEVEAAEAMGLCVYFDDFHIPFGGELFFESLEGVFDVIYREGPIDAGENNVHGRWVSGDIPGSVVKIIYRQPATSIGHARLGIMGVGFFVGNSERGSDDCQIDVMCPEGNSWQSERDAVVRLRITQNGAIYYCSGVMVNNTNLDCRQLLLGAFHCADAVEEDEWAYFKVRYNYEYLECGGTTSINSHTRTGVIPLTNSNDAASQGFNGSDFLLVEVEDLIPETWNPFYAGFDASGEPGHSGVGIHHPAGDRKKISSYINPLTSYNIGGAESHWRVYWTATETNHGVTEGGSSGSPIFNENHQIVGTLSSGLSACVNGGAGNGTGPFQPDYYGQMSYHWDGPNPIADAQKLKHFLDPSGSGQTVLYGSYVGDGDQACGNFQCFELCSGCTDYEACNYDSEATIADETCEYPEEWYDCDGECISDVDNDGICDELEIIGCTDLEAFNYNPEATDSDNTLCIYFVPDCNSFGDPGWLDAESGAYPGQSSGVFGEMYNEDIALHLSTTIVEAVSGVSYAVESFDFASMSGLPDGLFSSMTGEQMTPNSEVCVNISGIPIETGVFDILLTGEAFINVFGNSIYAGVISFTHTLEIGDNPNPISGCTYPGSDNYLVYAMVDDGSCIISGCTDPEASNFHLIFNLENGSCQFVEDISDCIEDINQDGTIGTPDLLQLLSTYGQICD
jgi:hypothetical protein